jgi:hypothetical protein
MASIGVDGSYRVAIDQARNRLYVTFRGYFREDDARVACAEVLRQAGELEPGFSIVTDISEFTAASEEGAEVIKETQAALAELGVGRIVRVVGKNVVANMQMTRTAREIGYDPGTEADAVGTVAEADTLLDA